VAGEPHMIKVIIFDLGKVLLDFNNHLISQRLANISGQPEDEIFDYIFRTPLETHFDRGEITGDEFFNRVKTRLSLTISYDEFIPLWCDIFTPITGMKSLVERLRGRYQIGILSNTNALHFAFVREKYPVVRAIDNYHLSYAMHLQKPEEAIYRGVLDFYRCRPDEMAYADDIEEYVDAARRIGIQAFQFTAAERLIEDFKGIGIEIPSALHQCS
jgi:putative hydrolase of the HAD superfamily